MLERSGYSLRSSINASTPGCSRSDSMKARRPILDIWPIRHIPDEAWQNGLKWLHQREATAALHH